MNFNKFNANIIFLAICISLSTTTNYAQGFVDQITLNGVTALQSTGEKPQSKVWKYNNKWWAIIPVAADGPDAEGTWLWRLDGNTWVKLISISTSTVSHADVKAVGGISYILLLEGTSSELVVVQHVLATNTYSIVTTSPITLDSGVEAATIDIDTDNILWVASNEVSGSNGNIYVRWCSTSDYVWSERILIASGVFNDDICAITSFTDNSGDRIGVMWSDQNNTKFGFAYHNDGASKTSWTSQTIISVSSPGLGVADDHINFAVASNGTIYAAVKTGYNTNGDVQVGLLVRSPNGSWSGLYGVRNRDFPNNRTPTRPIALLNETKGTITVIYTQEEGGNDIMYKSVYTSSLNSFSPSSDGTYLIPNDVHSHNNVTSTKQNFDSEVVVLASTSGHIWDGVMAGTDPLPVELAFFSGNLNGSKIELRWKTETEVNNYGFNVERATDSDNIWNTIAFVEGNGNSNSPKYYEYNDADIYGSGTYWYRLKQIDNDGTFKYSNTVNVDISSPANFFISQNYPNPFNPVTRIDFNIPEKQHVTLKVYNSIGEQVVELINDVRNAGTYSITFDGSDLPSGTYFYTIVAGTYIKTNKMSLVK